MKFSEYFNTNKGQSGLDFVDIFLEKDIKLFIDPWAIRESSGQFSIECISVIDNFFQLLIKKISKGDDDGAIDMLSFSHEVKEMHLGNSLNSYNGLGMSDKQARDIFKALKESKAVKTGIIQDLEDCALMIEGINKDKISDMVANIIKLPLIRYTQEQCALYNIPTTKVAAGYYWDTEEQNWVSVSAELPIVEVKGRSDKILLVPKSIVRRDLSLNYEEFYNMDILAFEQSRYLNACHSLVRTLKNGQKRAPFKKDIKKDVGKGKAVIVEYVTKHPELISLYKDRKNKLFKPISNLEILVSKKESFDEIADIDEKIDALKKLQGGKKDAYKYHDLTISILNILFYPHLSKPRKEDIIDSGRKKVDIVYNNDALSGFFMRAVRKSISADKVFFECKNYTEDIANPEIDQLAGRLTRNTSRLGFLLCRNIEDRQKVLSSCRFHYHGNGNCLIILDDNDIIKLLELKKLEKEDEINDFLNEKFDELTKVDD